MVSSEVQRTLVKSPPELWAELSDETALARHLEIDGELRLTHVEPERLLEWEAQHARGRVELSPSGWGTKVKLSLEREAPASERDEPDEDELEVDEPDEDELEVDEPATASEPVEPRHPPRMRSFLSRLFRRRGVQQSNAGSGAEGSAARPEATSTKLVEPVAPPDASAAEAERPPGGPVLSAALRNAEERLTIESEALLNGVLDRLGAAHHRPFSRS
ncbi:MAG: hypothetical protein ACYCUM_02535 [Solirubrobacteraceae bacterium]